MTLTEFIQLFSGGSVTVLAAVVWWELKEGRKETADKFTIINEEFHRFSATLAAILERDRFRDEISGVHASSDQDDTPVENPHRRRTSPQGVPIGSYSITPRKGTKT